MKIVRGIMFDRICRVLFLLASVSAGSVSASVFDEVALWLDAQDAGPVGSEVKVWRDHRGLPLEAKSSMDGGASSRPHYELGTPLFEEITIDLGHRFGRGGTFVIRAPNVSRERKYIQKAILNGKPVEGFKIDASEVLKGGELDFEIDNHP